MIFRNALERALGSSIKIRILRYLFSEGVPASEREISRILGISHMSVNRAMRDFEELNLVMRSHVGGAHLWQLKSGTYLYNQLKGLMICPTPLDALKEQLIKEMKNLEASYSITIKKAFLFGSIAEKKEEASSDIDVFIVVDKKKELITKELTELGDKIIVEFGNRLSTQVFTEQQYLHPNKTEKILIEKAEKGIRLI